MTETIDAAAEARAVAAVRPELFIGGDWRPAAGGGRLAVEDPSTTETLTEVADADASDALAALDAAAGAQSEWAGTAPRDRGELLRRAYELLVERADDFALLMTLEMGKPVAESVGEVRYAADFLRWFSEEAVRVSGRYNVAPAGNARHLVLQRPVGPCLLITPWNFPLAMLARKIGPALAAGCTTVVKPAEQTPLTALAFAALLEEVGVPGGVVNVVPTSDPGAVVSPLLADPRLRKLSFTGSTEVGRLLGRQAADRVLRTSLELGGNAPFLVFADADLEAAVEGAMLAKMRNGGEACTAANRFLVHESVAVEFSRSLAERMAAQRVGRGTEPDVQLGPLIDAPTRDKVARLVDDARGAGAEVVTGGSAVDRPGWFWEPTVLTDVPPSAQILAEEVFGPVAPISTFTDDDEAIARANDTDYGLVAYAYTRDLERALSIVERLETGMVGLNRGVVSDAAAPFGGVKQSGLGREGGREGIAEYLETTYVALPR